MKRVQHRMHRVRVPARFHPPHSLLGLAIRRHVGDPYRAETWYLVVAGVVLAALLVTALAAQSLAGSLLPVGFWAIVGLAPFLVLIGFRRGYAVSLDDRHLEVNRGRERLRIALRHVRDVSILDAADYHRGDARDPRVVRFVNDYRHRLVSLSTDDATIVIGIPESSEDLLTHLRPHVAATSPAALAEA